MISFQCFFMSEVLTTVSNFSGFFFQDPLLLKGGGLFFGLPIGVSVLMGGAKKS